jgi:hypothetical protein
MVVILALRLKAPIWQINNNDMFVLHLASIFIAFLFSAILKVKQSLSLKDSYLESLFNFSKLKYTWIQNLLLLPWWCLMLSVE